MIVSPVWMKVRVDSPCRNKPDKMGSICTEEMKFDPMVISDMALEPKLCCKFPPPFFLLLLFVFECICITIIKGIILIILVRHANY